KKMSRPSMDEVFAYQSIDINEEIIINLNKMFPIPQKTFFIDTPVDICMQRLEKRTNREIYEHHELQLKIRDKYTKGINIFKNLGWNIQIIDGTKSIDEIFREITENL
ncbi:MAG: hypothetical protein II220_06430, partial [Spirochaetales bacterium]|nr:hypothetical protein [Spirochaetales bacterium]